MTSSSVRNVSVNPTDRYFRPNPHYFYEKPKSFPANDPRGRLGRHPGSRKYRKPGWLGRTGKVAGKLAPLAGLASDVGLFGIADKVLSSPDTSPTVGRLISGGLRSGLRIRAGGQPGRFDHLGPAPLYSKPFVGPPFFDLINQNHIESNIWAPGAGQWRWMYPSPPYSAPFGRWRYENEWIWESPTAPHVWRDPLRQPRVNPRPRTKPRIRIRNANRPIINSVTMTVTRKGLEINFNATPHRPSSNTKERKFNGWRAVAALLIAMERLGDAIAVMDIFSDGYNIEKLKKAGFLDYENKFQKWAHTLRHLVQDVLDNGVLDGMETDLVAQGLTEHYLWERVGAKIGQWQKGLAEQTGTPLDIWADVIIDQPNAKEATATVWSL